MILTLTLSSLDRLCGMVDVYNYIIRVVNILTFIYVFVLYFSSHACPASMTTFTFATSCVVHWCMSSFHRSTCPWCHFWLYFLNVWEKLIVGRMISASVASGVVLCHCHSIWWYISQVLRCHRWRMWQVVVDAQDVVVVGIKARSP